MTHEDIWNTQETIAALLGCPIPRWIDQDIDAPTVASIDQGGCASGAYMPAVTYYQALQTMAEHGDDVLQYIEDQLGELPKPPFDTSWSQMAVFYLSYAVELWASGIMSELEELDLEGSE